MRKIIKVLIYSILVIVLLVVVANVWITFSTKDRIFHDLDQLKYAKTGVILGTSKYARDGSRNEFFHARIEAAARLFHGGKIDHILVSGDNRTRYYNEPQDMLEALILLGVPTESITSDPAGYRTLDSIVRAKTVFGQHSFVVVTQDFHAYRALFIANRFEINAQAYSAENPEKFNVMVMLRETIARPFAILDLYVWNTLPEEGV